MRNLGLVVLREWDHFRRSFLLLLGTVGLAVMVHVLVLTIIPGTALAEFLVIFKSIVIPSLFVIICGMMGYADSPERGGHDFRTRPIRLRTLYAGKLVLIAGVAGGIVLVQSLMNLAAGFPMDFLTMWWPLVLAGVSGFFFAGVVRSMVGALIGFGVMLFLFWIGTAVAVGVMYRRVDLPFSEPGLRRFVEFAAISSLCVLLGRNTIPWRLIRWAGFFALMIGCGFLVYTTPVELREVDEVDMVLKKRLTPELTIDPDRFEGTMGVSFEEELSRETILRRLSFSPQVIELGDQNDRVFRIPVHDRNPRVWTSEEERAINSALGLVPWFTEKEKLRVQGELFGRRQHSAPMPPELEGKEVTMIVEGFAHLTKVTSLGSLPMEEGAKISGEDATVEILELQKDRDRVRLRVYSRSGSSIRVGAFQKNPENPHRLYGEIKRLTHKEVTRGMSSVDFVEVGVHYDLIDEFSEAAELHLFVVRDEGVLPFRSQPETTFWDGERNPQKKLKADYPIVPSITPFSTK